VHELEVHHYGMHVDVRVVAIILAGNGRTKEGRKEGREGRGSARQKENKQKFLAMQEERGGRG